MYLLSLHAVKADTNDIQIMCCLGLYSARLGDIILIQNSVRYIGIACCGKFYGRNEFYKNTRCVGTILSIALCCAHTKKNKLFLRSI